MSSESVTHDASNSTKNEEAKNSKMSFLNPHPVVRMVRSHDISPKRTTSSTASDPYSSERSTPVTSLLSSSKWYRNFKNFKSYCHLHNCTGSREGVEQKCVHVALSESPSLTLPASCSKNPIKQSASHNTESSSKFSMFHLGKYATRTKSAGSSTGIRSRLGLNTLKNETCYKLDKVDLKRKTGLETQLALLEELTKKQSIGLSFDCELCDIESIPSRVDFKVSQNEWHALRLVNNLDLLFVADVLVPKSKYLGRLAFRKLRKRSSNRSCSRGDMQLSIVSSTSVVTADENNLPVIHADCTWRCLATPLAQNNLMDALSSDSAFLFGQSTSTWAHKNGQTTIEIPDTPMFALTEAEIVTLQKLAVICLRNADFGCNIIIPRDVCDSEFPSDNQRRIVGGINSRWNHIRKVSASRANDNHSASSKVFGVPLGSLVQNQEKEPFPVGGLRKATPEIVEESNPDPDEDCRETSSPSPDLISKEVKVNSGVVGGGTTAGESEADLEDLERLKKYLLCEQQATETIGKAALLSCSYGDLAAPNKGAFRKMSHVALTEATSPCDLRARGPSFSSIYSILARSASSLVDALTLSHETHSTPGRDSVESDSMKYAVPKEPCVPVFVKTCVNWLREHDGLNTLGIFRVAGSQKRMKLLRESFECGGDCNWPDEQPATVHDVAALVKAFLRELPDGLLSKELYHPLIATTKISDSEMRLRCVKYLLCLLPRASRDTLQYILSFLHEIHAETLAEQSTQSSPETSGSQMNAANLATVFGPTLIKPPSAKLSSHPHGDIEVEKMEYIEDYTPIVNITKTLILCHQQLFQLDGATTGKVLQVIQETNAEATDFIINQRYRQTLSSPTNQMQTSKSERQKQPIRSEQSIRMKDSQKRTSQTSRSLSCCRHSIKQARERFFQEANTSSRPYSPPSTPVPLTYQDHYRKFSCNDYRGFSEVGVYTRRFRSNKLSRGQPSPLEH